MKVVHILKMLFYLKLLLTLLKRENIIGEFGHEVKLRFKWSLHCPFFISFLLP
jgi:hypothetical protein